MWPRKKRRDRNSKRLNPYSRIIHIGAYFHDLTRKKLLGGDDEYPKCGGDIGNAQLDALLEIKAAGNHQPFAIFKRQHASHQAMAENGFPYRHCHYLLFGYKTRWKDPNDSGAEIRESRQMISRVTPTVGSLNRYLAEKTDRCWILDGAVLARISEITKEQHLFRDNERRPIIRANRSTLYRFDQPSNGDGWPHWEEEGFVVQHRYLECTFRWRRIRFLATFVLPARQFRAIARLLRERGVKVGRPTVPQKKRTGSNGQSRW